jgi:hypothetical protein
MNRLNKFPHDEKSVTAKISHPNSNVIGVNRRQPRAVSQLPQHHSPAWLKSLLAIQRGSLILFGGTIGLSALIYGNTARTQDLWKSQHQKLQRLQAQESQQALMTENLKQQLVETTQKPASGFVDPSSTQIVFIPTPQRPTKAPAPAQSPAPVFKSKLPLGY